MSDAPGRIDAAYAELLGGYGMSPAEILTTAATVGPEGYSGVVEVSAIPFASFCAHHFLPFVGTIDVSYVPGPRILGLGKIPRLVACRSRRFQLQEQLVREVATDMVDFGEVRAVEVTAVAIHVCICYRGPNMASVETRSVYSIGRVPK